MEIEFSENYLRDLYESGKTKNKKYRFQPQVIRKYIDKVNILRGATRIEDLFPIHSLNYEKLTNENGKQSIRVDGSFRIEFYTRTEGTEPDIITICDIVNLSNHYK